MLGLSIPDVAYRNTSSLAARVSALFRSGEQGVWYDPSDRATLFQDASGITPVTAVEQPVGLMLDKSKGLVLGPELIVNSAWTASTGWSVDKSTGVATAIAAEGTIRNNGTGGSKLIAGKWYQATIRLVSYVSGSVGYPYDGTGFISIPTTPGTYTYRFLCDNPNDWTYVYCKAFTGVVDNISVRELPGNHAYQSTSASRPVLSARYNLLTSTERFDNPPWYGAWVYTKTYGEVAPDGSLTAAKLTATSIPAAISQSVVSSPAEVVYTLYLKAGTHLPAAGIRNDTTSTILVLIDISAISGSNAYGMWNVEAVGGGWKRCTITINSGITPGDAVSVYMGAVGAVPAGNYWYVWHPDLGVTNDRVNLPHYQRVNTPTDYDTAGFPHYLKFDGIDDSLVTNSIDFTATDKVTVAAGVRKLSDAAIGILCELSSTYINDGSFNVMAPPNDGLARYGSSTRGTTSIAFQASYPYSHAAPITSVLSSALDNAQGAVAANAIKVRHNGVAMPSNSDGLGRTTPANYGNYPLYIGSRAGASLRFNGHIYSLIVRGAQSSDAQIASVERWINYKTRAY